MLRTSVVFFLVAIATRSTAAPFEDEDISGSESFENDVYGIPLGDLQKQRNNDYACTNFYTFTCNKSSNENVHQLRYKDHLALSYSSEVYDALIEILNDEISEKEDPIDIDRELFQSCMDLGNDDDTYFESEPTIEITFNNMLQRFGLEVNEENWQKLDQKLALLGFKHSFYEIDVVKDPESNKNIIRLSPPSMSEWNFKKITDVVSDIFTQQQLDSFDDCVEKYNVTVDESNDHKYKAQPDDVYSESEEEEESTDTKRKTKSENRDPLCVKLLQYKRSDLTAFIVEYSNRQVINLLNDILKGIFDTMDTSNKGRKVQRLTIDDWNKTYAKNVTDDEAAINWNQVLKSYFENLKINVENTEYILVENIPYFFKMAEIFNYSINKAIAHTIRSKFVAENMRYYDWNKVYNMNPVYKPSFCLEQNQFYGASAEVLERLKLKMKPYHKKIGSLLYGIVGAFHSNISSAKVSETKKTTLLSNLKDFTKDPFKPVDHLSLSEYYKDFETTGDYLVDINSYKSMLRKRNLLKLRDDSLLLHRSMPFSVLEVENPRNRYILHSALNAIIYKNKFLLNKDAVYGTFGVKSASFLFSLLKENTFENDLRDFRGILAITPRVSYKYEQVACFIQQNVVKYGYPAVYDIITEVFGIRFAYEAMLHHSKSQSTGEFFTAYAQNHCRENDGKIITKVLSNVHDFSMTLNCSKKDTACKLRAF